MSSAYTEFTNDLIRIIDEVCSSVYQETFEKLVQEMPANITSQQSMLLFSYPNYINWYEGDRRDEIIERIRHTHLKWFNKFLGEHYTGQPPYIQWASYIHDLMLHTTNILFRMDLGDVITTDETRNDCRQIADTITRILTGINQSNPDTIDQNALPLVRLLLVILFYFTLDSDLVIYLKSLQLVNLMNDLLRTSNNDDEIHLQAYRLLAVIMAETDIKQLQNANRIAQVFITFIADVIDEGTIAEGRLHNTLRTLKILTQHDQIREELIKQQGHILFLRCALEDKFNPIKAKLPALEILLALAFNQEFANTLKNNQTFMNHLRTLTSSSEQDIQRVSTALIWKLEKEQDTNNNHTTKKDENQSSPTSVPKLTKKQYDIMISYSHTDKDLCHRILNVLENEQLNVWIDSKLMHGATFDAMAKAIENAEFVLVCMSDAYKQSPFCEMEASYAVKRRCHIIPIVMTPSYKADGWLGVLTSALIYVDFPKLGFDKGYDELKRQIGLHRMTNDSNLRMNKQDQLHHNPGMINDVTLKPSSSIITKKEPRPVTEYPHCIDVWSEEHVKSFLLDKELNSLLSAFDGMNGRLLHKAYSMCQGNEQAMFSSLKEEVARNHLTTTLSLKEYLTFLEEIKVYVPYKTGDLSNPASAVCNLM